MALQAPLTVTAPAGAKPLPGGLRAVAEIIDISDVHVGNGVNFRGEACGVNSHLAELCHDDILGLSGLDRDPDAPEVVEAGPFGIERSIECGPQFEGELRGYTERAFERGEDWALENGFQVGVLNPNATVLDGTGTIGPVQALALLEQYAASMYGSRPTIHVSRFGATHMAAAKLTDQDSNYTMSTRQGSPIANCSGHEKTGPGAVVATATQFWMYVTGHVAVYRSKAEYLQGVNIQNNQMTGSVQRVYAPTYECFAAAILVGVQ